MLRWIRFSLLAAGLTVTAAACDSGWTQHQSDEPDTNGTAKADQPASRSADIGKTLYEVKAPPQAPAEAVDPQGVALDPVVIPAHFAVISKEDVPSLRDGAIEFIGREFRKGELESLTPEQAKELVVDVKIDGHNYEIVVDEEGLLLSKKLDEEDEKDEAKEKKAERKEDGKQEKSEKKE